MSRIENVGFFARFRTVLSGKNRQFREFTDAINGDTITGDFIVTIGKRAIIVTQVKNGRRVPIIIKQWMKTKTFKSKGKQPMFLLSCEDDRVIIEEFIDSDKNKWIHTSLVNAEGEGSKVACEDNNNNLIYEFN